MALLPLIVIFVEYILGSLLEVIAFCGFSFLIYKSRKLNGPQLSHSMTLYVVCCIFQSFFGFIHLFYFAIFYDKDAVTYNAYYIFFTGTAAVQLLLTVSICVTFLSIDRILIVLFPMKYNSRQKKLALILSLATIIFVNAFVFAFDMIIDFPSSASTSCRAFACLKVNSEGIFYSNVRFVIAATNVLAGIFLAAALSRHLRGDSISARANRLIFITVILTLCFDFLLHLAGFTIFKNQITTFHGPHSVFFGSLEMSTATLLYCQNILKPFKFRQTTVISQNNNMSNSRR